MKQNPGPFDLGQSLNEALALQRQGRLRDAEKIYTRVLKAAPDHFDALNLLGTVKAQLGRMGEAHRLLSAAVKINPRAAGAWINLGEVLQALKRNEEALECFDKARALAPDDVDILNQHANALLSLDRAARGARRIPAGFGARAAACRGAGQLRHRARRARRAGGGSRGIRSWR